nr:MAG TPA: hypothetical protein [Caudoviricetes sp.]
MGWYFATPILPGLHCFTVAPKAIRGSGFVTPFPKGVRRFGVFLRSVRRTRSHRMKSCVQKGFGGAALNKQTAGNVSVY